MVNMSDKTKTFPAQTFILDNQNRPMAEPELLTWSKWMSRLNNVQRKFTMLDSQECVSTCFKGAVYTPQDKLFETMVVGGKLDGLVAGYDTLEEALAGHDQIVARCLDS